MGQGSCYGILRFHVILINIIFFLAGLLIAGISAWVLINPIYPVVQDANNYMNGFIIMLVVGVLLILVGTLGCCGAYKESQKLLIAFFSVLLIVVVAQIATVVWAYMNQQQLHELFKVNMERTVEEEYGVVDSMTETFDTFQKDLKCCGAQGPRDWQSSKYGTKEAKNVDLTITSPLQKYVIPPSCCGVEEEDALCVAGRQAIIGGEVSDIIYQDGCIVKVYDYIESYAPLLLGLTIAAALLELLGLALSIILCCGVRFVDRYNKPEY